MKIFTGEKSCAVWTVLAVLFTIISLFSSTVTAQNSCDQIVIDEPGVLGNRLGEIEEDAQRLIGSGADVRVRIIQTFGDAGNLDRFETEMEQQCASWTDAAGNRKNNLIVFMVALDEQQTGLYFGSQWENALGDRWTQIQSDIMNPRFARGDFAGGLIAGMDEVNRLITGQPGGQEPPAQGGVSAGWIILGIVLFIAALLIGLFYWRNYRKSREKRQAARQKALLAKQGAASKVNDLVAAVQMLEIKVNATALKAAPEDSAPLIEGLNKTKRLVDQGAQRYSELSHSAGNPENPGLAVTQLEVIASEYQKLLETLREASDTKNQVETGVAALQQAINGFNDRLSEVDTAIESANRKIEAAQGSGYKAVQPTRTLALATQLRTQAVSLSQQKKYIQAVESLAKAGEAAAQAASQTDELSRKKEEIETALRTLELRIEQVKNSIIRGKDIFERIARTYVESSWEPIEGNGTEAENRINWTQEALDKARTLASMENQDWQEAQKLVKQGDDWLDEAESLMHSISVMETNLEAARRDAPGEIEAAQADITRAWEYINAYDEDIRESLEDDLREAEKKLNAAREEMTREQVDYLKADKLAEEANEAADKILAQARSEHEAAERLRSKAAAALRNARTKVSAAREYLQDHRRDAGDEARRLLSEAESSLQQAETEKDPDTQVSLAQKAEKAAGEAYSSARARVESIQERRQPGFPPLIIISGGGSRRGGSSWGSRRSSPWGSGGGGSGWRIGGGGSSGWGGGRGGGGSSRW